MIRKIDSISVSNLPPPAKRVKLSPLENVAGDALNIVGNLLPFQDWKALNRTSKTICKKTDQRERAVNLPPRQKLTRIRGPGLRASLVQMLPHIQMPGWEKLRLLHVRFSSGSMDINRLIGHLPNHLHTLTLDYYRIGNKAIVPIGKQIELKQLVIRDLFVTTFKPFHSLKLLRHLVLKDVKRKAITQEKIIDLLKALPNLEHFGWLNSKSVSPQLMKQFGKLRSLDLMHTVIQKPAYPELLKLTNLRKLSLSGSNLAGRDLIGMERMSLEELRIISSNLPNYITTRLPQTLHTLTLSRSGTFYTPPVHISALRSLTIDVLVPEYHSNYFPHLEVLKVRTGLNLYTLSSVATLKLKHFSTWTISNGIENGLCSSLYPICPSLGKAQAKEWKRKLSKGVSQKELQELAQLVAPEVLEEKKRIRENFFEKQSRLIAGAFRRNPAASLATFQLIIDERVISLFPQSDLKDLEITLRTHVIQAVTTRISSPLHNRIREIWHSLVRSGGVFR